MQISDIDSSNGSGRPKQNAPVEPATNEVIADKSVIKASVVAHGRGEATVPAPAPDADWYEEINLISEDIKKAQRALELLQNSGIPDEEIVHNVFFKIIVRWDECRQALWDTFGYDAIKDVFRSPEDEALANTRKHGSYSFSVMFANFWYDVIYAATIQKAGQKASVVLEGQSRDREARAAVMLQAIRDFHSDGSSHVEIFFCRQQTNREQGDRQATLIGTAWTLTTHDAYAGRVGRARDQHCGHNLPLSRLEKIDELSVTVADIIVGTPKSQEFRNLPSQVEYALWKLYASAADQQRERDRQRGQRSGQAVVPSRQIAIENVAAEEHAISGFQHVEATLDAQQKLKQAKELLTPKEWAVFEQYCLQEKSSIDTAIAIGSTPQAVDVHVSNLRRKLAPLFGVGTEKRVRSRQKRGPTRRQ